MATQRSATITRQTGAPIKVGGEDSNAAGLAAIRDFISNTGDRILHHTTFDFGAKVMALTLQGIILADTDETGDDDNPYVVVATYGELRRVADTGHDREIKLIFNEGVEVTHRMGNAQAVAQLKNLIRTYRSNFLSLGDPELWTADDDEYDEVDDDPDIGAPGIAEKVRFWEEQDRINQALIPRVIRQNELLTKHIAEHDDLPQLVGTVIADALAEQARQYEAALEEATARLNAAYAQALQSTDAKYEARLEKATAQLNAAHVQALQTANAEQEKLYDSAIAKVRQEARRTRNRLTAVAASAVAVAVAAVIIAVLV